MVAAFENIRLQAEADQLEMLKGKQWERLKFWEDMVHWKCTLWTYTMDYALQNEKAF